MFLHNNSKDICMNLKKYKNYLKKPNPWEGRGQKKEEDGEKIEKKRESEPWKKEEVGCWERKK